MHEEMKPQAPILQRSAGPQLMKMGSCLVLAIGLLIGGVVFANDQSTIEIVIKDHVFMPAQVHIPAGKPALLRIKNQDDSAEEFESHSLKIEKIITGGGEILVRLRPLPVGQYGFFGEYNPVTAVGVVIVE